MIAIEDKLISDDLVDKHFVCNLTSCKGACCLKGDAGAPLEEEELSLLEDHFEDYKPYLREEGINTIKTVGHYVHDFDDDAFKTPITGDGACVYYCYEDGIGRCGVEKAFEAGAITFKKPISCHLYPVRIKKYVGFEAVNYDSWKICDPACALGDELKIPVYEFVKEALIRKYGPDFYYALEQQAQLVQIRKN